MSKWKLYLYGMLALLGTAAMIGYFAVVAPEAPSSFQLSILIFTGLAALVGWLGLLISWLTYRLEAGKVPRPDLAILVDGKPTKHWRVPVEFVQPRGQFSDEIEMERRELLKLLPPLPKKGGASHIAAWQAFSPFESHRRDQYQIRVESYLEEYEQYLSDQEVHNAFWKRSHVLILAFTNERAGAPAEGVKVLIRMPDKDEVETMEATEVPPEPEAPERPEVPKPGDYFGSLYSPARIPGLADLAGRSVGNVGPPAGNVSPPSIREGSLILEYDVSEILHNLHEDNRDESVVLFFKQPGRWTLIYEIHARNLLQPKKGSLIIDAYEEH